MGLTGTETTKGLTGTETTKILLRVRALRMSGRPMEAMKVQQALDADQLPDPSLMKDGGVKADARLVGNVDLTVPPRHGKGSGQKAWVGFAALVTDMDAEVLERMQRDDIIGTLEAKGNIPSE